MVVDLYDNEYIGKIMSNRVAIVGGGGFAKEVIAIFELNEFRITGIFASESIVQDYPHVSDSEKNLHNFRDTFDSVFLSIGVANSRDIKKRRKVMQFLIDEGFKSSPLISKTAIVSKGSTIGCGTFVAHSAVISVDAEIGDYTVVNTSVIVGHDTIIGNNVTISPSVFIGGNVKIGDDVLLGSGCIIMQGVSIGPGSVIGMGSVVTKNIVESGVYAGNPAKKIKEING